MAINIASGIPIDWDYQLGEDTPIFFGGNPPNVVMDSAGVQWAMSEIDGWDSADLRRDVFGNMFNQGATMGAAFFAERTLSSTGMMIAPDLATLDDAKERLRLALPINEDVPLIANETVPKYMSVRRSGRVITKNLGQFPQPAATFSIGMIAGDPRKYALLSQTLQLDPLISGPGAAFPWVFPLQFSVPVAVGRNLLRNQGTEDAPVKISLYGPLSSPILLERISGYRLGLNMELLAGQRVDIDTELGSVLLQGESVYGALSVDVLEPLTVPPRSVSSFLLLGSGTGHAVLTVSDTWQ